MKKIFLLIMFLLLTSCNNNVITVDYDDFESNELKFVAPQDVSGYILNTSGDIPEITDEDTIKKVIEYYCSLELYLVDDWELDLKTMLKLTYISDSLRKNYDNYADYLFRGFFYEDYFYVLECGHYSVVYEGCISHTYRSKNKIDREKFKNDIKMIVESQL